MFHFTERTSGLFVPHSIVLDSPVNSPDNFLRKSTLVRTRFRLRFHSVESVNPATSAGNFLKKISLESVDL